MFRQQFACFLDAVSDARGKFTVAKITTHRLRQLPPEFVAALGVNRFIAAIIPITVMLVNLKL